MRFEDLLLPGRLDRAQSPLMRDFDVELLDGSVQGLDALIDKPQSWCRIQVLTQRDVPLDLSFDTGYRTKQDLQFVSHVFDLLRGIANVVAEGLQLSDAVDSLSSNPGDSNSRGYDSKYFCHGLAG